MQMIPSVVSLQDYEDVFGKEALLKELAGFSCPLNPEVERFLREKALHSATLSTTVTYLVLGKETGELLGYFSLLAKPYVVRKDILNSNNRRLISRFAEFDEETGKYMAAVYLIAQIGKNYAIDEGKGISGADLLTKAKNVIREVKSKIGGKLVLVEREADRPKLLAFYKDNGFKSWSKRHSKLDGNDYDQMMAVL